MTSNEVFQSIINEDTQVQIAEADNTEQYWPNLGSQQSAIVIGSVCPFASVKCWSDDRGLCRLLNLPTFSRNLDPVSALYQADCHFYHGIQFRKQKSQSPAHGRHITGPCVTFSTANHSRSEKTRDRHSIGRFLCRKQMLTARIWARIDRQVHIGVIIPATTRYWQTIFGKFLPMMGQQRFVSNFGLGYCEKSQDFKVFLNFKQLLKQ